MDHSKASLSLSKALWSLPHEELFRLLETQAKGLSSFEAEARLQNFGLNKLSNKQSHLALRLLLGQCRDLLIFVLFVFAINVFAAKPAIDSLLFAIALAVGMAPELLPAIISLILSKGA